MSEDQSIAVICVGATLSPFVKGLVTREVVSVSYITNNACDFQIHHADPSKQLTYHLEFTNIIEQKAKRSIDSLAVFETLGKFFEFYNPLHLSTLNYLISKYATNVNPTNKNLTSLWKEITKAIFDEENILPVFDTNRVLHVKEGEVEIPVRQCVLSKEIRENGEDGEKSGKKKEKEKQKKQKEGEDNEEFNLTGIIDILEIEKMKPSEEAMKEIENASAVILVPTDVISLYILFQSQEYRDVLKNAVGKIACISPFWDDQAISPVEQEILEKTGFEPTLLNIITILKDLVDTIIINNSNKDMISSLRDMGIMVLVEDLNPEKQMEEHFLETVMKSVDLSLDAIETRSKEGKEKIGEKLVTILSNRFSKKKPGELEEKLKEEPGAEDEESHDQEGIEGEIDTSGVPGKQEQPSIEQVPKTPDMTIASNPESTSPSATGEMKPVEGGQPPVSKAITPAPEAGDIVSTTAPSQSISAADGNAKAQVTGSIPSESKNGTHIPMNGEVKEIVEIDQVISSKIDKAITPAYEEKIDTVFSDLLELQQNMDNFERVFSALIDKLHTLDELSPESRLIDIIAYLSANNPELYSSLFSELLQQIMLSDEETTLRDELDAAMLIMQSSPHKREEALHSFISEFIIKDDLYTVEKLRKVLTYFISKDQLLANVVLRILIELFKEELEKEDRNSILTNRLVFFLSTFDAFKLGQGIIEYLPTSLFDDVKELLGMAVFSSSHATLILTILEAFNESEYEILKQALNVQRLPKSIHQAILKRRYVNKLSKVGSVPLELFAEQMGLSIKEAEKIVYDMILKGDITAKMEVVNGRLYVVQDLPEKKDEDGEPEANKDKKDEDNDGVELIQKEKPGADAG